MAHLKTEALFQTSNAMLKYAAFPPYVKAQRSEYLMEPEPQQINNTGQQLRFWKLLVGREAASRRAQISIKAKNISRLVESRLQNTKTNMSKSGFMIPMMRDLQLAAHSFV